MKTGNDQVRDIRRALRELEDNYAQLTAMLDATRKALQAAVTRINILESKNNEAGDEYGYID